METKHLTFLEFLFSDMLSNYRWVVLLHVLANCHKDTDAYKAAQRDFQLALTEVFPEDPAVSYEEVLLFTDEFISSNKAWINYALGDMGYYLEQLFMSSPMGACLRLQRENYLGKMQNQQDFLRWNSLAFAFRVSGAFDLLDVGCGTMPYLEKLVEMNPSLQNYFAIDKRAATDRLIHEKAQQTTLVHRTVDLFTAKGSEICQSFRMKGVEALFFGNSLHCFPDSDKALFILYHRFPDLKRIFILEPKHALSGIGSAFGFHMFVHAGSSRIMPEQIIEFARKIEYEYSAVDASTQHVMYQLTKV